MILITSAYHEPVEARRVELKEALLRNVKSGLFTKIILLVEGQPGYIPVDPCLVIHKINRRPTFDNLFMAAVDKQITVVANSDIYFDKTLEFLKKYDFKNKFLAVSRREVLPFGKPGALHNPYRSQDAWIYFSPLPAFSRPFPIGRLGCDQRLAYEARKAGMQVLNPCLTLSAWHIHFSKVRRYTQRDRLGGPYIKVPPCVL